MTHDYMKTPEKKNPNGITVNSLHSGHGKDLGLVSSLVRVFNSGSIFQSNFCNFFVAWDLAAVRIFWFCYSGISPRRELTVHYISLFPFDPGKNDDLVPIVSEKYGKYGVKYYGVAIVKKINTGFTLEGLKGKKSCHTGARRTAGWNVPIGYLLRKKIIPPVKCDTEFHDFYSASKFFLESCVPGDLCELSLLVCSFIIVHSFLIHSFIH